MRVSPSVRAVSVALGICCLGVGCSHDGESMVIDKHSVEQVAAAKSDIDSDEEVVFFPTAAHLDEPSNRWVIPIHGSIYEPEQDSRKRAVVVRSLCQAVGVAADTPEAQRLEQRARRFLVDNERGQAIAICLGGEVYQVGVSEANGHFRAELRIAAASIEQRRSPQQQAEGFLRYTAVVRQTDQRSFLGRVHLVPPEGLSVISDIDDTIKHSQVGDHQAVLANTFLRTFEPVPGMPELYREWAQQGVAFHYVSGSPWQLYLPLADFLSTQQFPAGSVDLKHFRLKDPSALGLLQSQEDTKLRAITPILQVFPQRQFMLIGDSGEQDPEIYAQLARAYPQQIAGIFIRNVTQEQADNARIGPLRQGLESVQFLLFEDPAKLRPIVDEIIRKRASTE